MKREIKREENFLLGLLDPLGGGPLLSYKRPSLLHVHANLILPFPA
jgi:hypothetical protein